MWLVRLDKKAKKDLERLDRVAQVRIIEFLEHRVSTSDNPRDLGKVLKGKTFGEHIRFRVGSYRLICDIQDQEITVLVLRIGHRKEAYRG